MFTIIPAQSAHIREITNIFCEAFVDSIQYFTLINDKLKKAFQDIFDFLQEEQGQGFFVAVSERGEVLGYIVMIDDAKNMWKSAITSGFILKIIKNYIAGEYGLDFETIYNIIRNKLFYMKFEMGTKPSAQLLSIAVHPKYHGKGIGRKLIARGLQYIESLGIERIKLEVRPENIPALKLYESFGFCPIGQAQDLQGAWVVMMKDKS